VQVKLSRASRQASRLSSFNWLHMVHHIDVVWKTSGGIPDAYRESFSVKEPTDERGGGDVGLRGLYTESGVRRPTLSFEAGGQGGGDGGQGDTASFAKMPRHPMLLLDF
jgi:hypothetical protein